MAKSSKSKTIAEVSKHKVGDKTVVLFQTKKPAVSKSAGEPTEIRVLRREAVSGHLDGVDDEGRLLFKPEGLTESVPVVIGLPLSDHEVVRAASLGQRALVVRTTDKVPSHILVSLLRERVRSDIRDAAPNELKVRLDGETLYLRAKTQIELVCGKSRLVLHKNGRIEFKGSYLLSRSCGPNKIKGATVEIN
jgi:hypothetical protein